MARTRAKMSTAERKAKADAIRNTRQQKVQEDDEKQTTGDLHSNDDATLMKALKKLGATVGPVNDSTRSIYLRRLEKLMKDHGINDLKELVAAGENVNDEISKNDANDKKSTKNNRQASRNKVVECDENIGGLPPFPKSITKKDREDTKKKVEGSEEDICGLQSALLPHIPFETKKREPSVLIVEVKSLEEKNKRSKRKIRENQGADCTIIIEEEIVQHETIGIVMEKIDEEATDSPIISRGIVDSGDDSEQHGEVNHTYVIESEEGEEVPSNHYDGDERSMKNDDELIEKNVEEDHIDEVEDEDGDTRHMMALSLDDHENESIRSNKKGRTEDELRRDTMYIFNQRSRASLRSTMDVFHETSPKKSIEINNFNDEMEREESNHINYTTKSDEEDVGLFGKTFIVKDRKMNDASDSTFTITSTKREDEKSDERAKPTLRVSRNIARSSFHSPSRDRRGTYIISRSPSRLNQGSKSPVRAPLPPKPMPRRIKPNTQPDALNAIPMVPPVPAPRSRIVEKKDEKNRKVRQIGEKREEEVSPVSFFNTQTSVTIRNKRIGQDCPSFIAFNQSMCDQSMKDLSLNELML